MEPWVLVMPGKWVVLVAMVVCPMLAVPVVALLIAPSPAQWNHVAWVAVQISPWWWQEALAAAVIACTT